jgi:acyl-CoA thioester hydrolase
MKTYSFNYDVHIFDTDCYGVVWHGAYTKWLEMGRVNLFKSVGIDMKDLSDNHDIIFPVAEQNIRFKTSARLGEVLRLTTRIDVQPPKLIFYQSIQELHQERPVVEARTDVVLISNGGKMYRKFPEIMIEKLQVLDSSEETEPEDA